MKIILHGIYPRSEKLVQATRDYDRKRITLAELNQVFKEDINALKELQKDFEYKTQGQLFFQDLLRPFSEIVEDVEINGLKRFYETNCFYRTLNFKNFNLKENGNFFNHYLLCDGMFEKEEKLIFTFPFLFFFEEYSERIDVSQISKLLLYVIEEIDKWGNKIVVFYEPSFGWRNLYEDERKEAKLFVEELKKFKNTKFFLHTFFFNVEKEIPFIFSLDFDGYGFDFYSNSIEKIMRNFPQNKFLLAGIINTDSTLIEKKEIIIDFIEKVKKFIDMEKVYFCPSGVPELLPREIMDEKIKNLVNVLICEGIS